MSETGDKGETTQGPAPGAGPVRVETERSDHHMPEVLTVHKVWLKGVLSTQVVEFTHNCGRSNETWRQEELPW